MNCKESSMNIFSARRGCLFFLLCIINLLVSCIAAPVFSAEIPTQPVMPKNAPAVPADGLTKERERAVPGAKSDFSYENATISEDVAWKGSVVIRGYLLVAPQATLRIEQGTEIRFMKSPLAGQLPRLVVMGRIQCNGTPDNPVRFAPHTAQSARGDWGGILLLASEKRNLLEFCRIEGATTAIEALFSTFAARGVTISNAEYGIRLKDSTADLSQLDVSRSGTGVQANDSEVDLRDGTFSGNKTGIAVFHSGLSMVSTKLTQNRQGFLAEGSRIRVNGCEFSANEVGAGIVQGEGQLLLSKFAGNREAGLRLKGARIKVQRNSFADNQGDAIQAHDGKSIVLGSSFSGNGGYNLANLGEEEITAALNWWGSNEESYITAKAGSRKPGAGKVVVAPWLDRKPSGLP